MLAEAIEIINRLFDGDLVDHDGEHFRVASARLWDLPETRVPLAVAVSGDRSIDRFHGQVDHLIAVEPDPDLISAWRSARAETGPPANSSRAIGQLPICWDPDRSAAIERAHEEFRWFGGGWAVNADLPTTAGFAGATQFIRPEDVAEAIPCGPDIGPIVDAVREYTDAGFTDVAVVQIGAESQAGFLDFARTELLPGLREDR